SGRVVDAGPVEIEESLREQRRMCELRHRGVGPEAAAGVAIAEKMAVRIPGLAGVETMPGGHDQRVRGQLKGRYRIACVAQTFPQREIPARGERGDTSGKTEKTTPVHRRVESHRGGEPATGGVAVRLSEGTSSSIRLPMHSG